MTTAKSSFVVQRGGQFVFFVVHPNKLLYFYKEKGKLLSGEVVLPNNSVDNQINTKVDEVMAALAL